jgi:hydroxylamine reductase
MSMFCNQCQETARNKGCEYGGACGKSEDLADLQDLLIYTLKGISEIIMKGKLEIKYLTDVNH